SVSSSGDLSSRITEYIAGDRPPDPRMIRVRTSMHSGFRSDLVDFSADELKRNPFYQQFLRPRGVQWHACATIFDLGGVKIDLSFKRSPRAGAFQDDEIDILNSFAPRLRSALRIVARGSTLFAEGLLASAEARGDAAYIVDARRLVLAQNRTADWAGVAVKAVDGKLRGVDNQNQTTLEQAVTLATARTPAPSIGRLRSAAGQFILRTIPVSGLQGALAPATCMVTLVDLNPFRLFDDRLVEQVRTLFGLTAQEARLAQQIGAGRTVQAAAATLNMSVGTARNHLKNVLAKTDTHRQSELALLWARLRL
ncbi:MAG: hypothetical protein J0H41_04330, partial [Rhizobiales bacterium]|nr:hypothetical protein [Hyphomicrobiales bacterium]